MESAINAVKYALYLRHVKSDIRKLMPQRLHVKYPIHRQPVKFLTIWNTLETETT